MFAQKLKDSLWSFATDKALTSLLGGGLVSAVVLFVQDYLWSLPLGAKGLLGLSAFVLGYAGSLKVARKWSVGAKVEDEGLSLHLVADFEGDYLVVRVTNFEKSDEFSAQITYGIPLGNPYPLFPITVRWRGQSGETKHIATGGHDVLEVARVALSHANRRFEFAEFLAAHDRSVPFVLAWLTQDKVSLPVHLSFNITARKRELTQHARVFVAVGVGDHGDSYREAIIGKG